MRIGIESKRNETKRNEGGDSVAVVAAAIPYAIARKTRHANAKEFRHAFLYHDSVSFEMIKKKIKKISRIKLLWAFL